MPPTYLTTQNTVQRLPAHCLRHSSANILSKKLDPCHILASFGVRNYVSRHSMETDQMAPVAFILGGISGFFSVLVGWVVFGIGLWGAVQLYFAVYLIVAFGLIAFSLMRLRQRDGQKQTTLQRA